MHLAISEEALADRAGLRIIDAAPCHEQLQIDEVVRAFAAGLAQPVEFLGYLVGNRHEGNGTGAGQPDGLEHLHDEAGKAGVGLVGIPYLVVADFKVDGYPRLAVVVELYGKRLHDVGCRHSISLPYSTSST